MIYKKTRSTLAKFNKRMELLESARSLRKKKNYVRAVEVYNEILAEEPDDKTAIEAVQEIEGEIAEEQIKQDYIENIKILDFEAKRIDTWSDKNIPAVRFALKNEGDKTP